ncbi:family 1 glycosylhydrolase [Leptolyngbya sp. FACHB-261]|uniref:family 1 glycosylhydrolase n=1 Tax=Leptolyngbya sp. FACHB-261 TaxID=2692806 RepID=UPI001687F258|nr:family 1 glycosylhydrolase [Leptolyngbya sp. FACHB-261]MBD2099723.1 family 1 glycosylhydrolase [Leptolyngbya sp. FACHB-261]
MAQRPGIFPTFFISGFECSTFRWKEKQRRDLTEETQHDRHVREDYNILRSLGIAVAREGIPWPMIDVGGRYDFSRIDPMIEAMAECQISPIWDLCHYGYPDDLDPFSDAFTERFASYCRAAAEYVIPRLRGPYFFTPINEITFFSFCGGEWGWAAPYGTTKEDRFRLRLSLCKAAIAGVKAIREVEPQARMVHIDPLVQVVAPRDQPDQIEAAEHETYVDTFLAWDIIYGKEHPELGGSPEILDIVGANNYSFGQMEYRAQGPHQALEPHDDRIKPLHDLLQTVWQRYQRPMIIGETSGLGGGRAAWLKDVVEESLAAVNSGMDLHGICLFPAVDMPDWHTGEWLHNGICDLVPEGDDLKRVPHEPYVAELRRWQKEFNRVIALDEDPLSDPVELQDVVDAAKRLRKVPDQNWS